MRKFSFKNPFYRLNHDLIFKQQGVIMIKSHEDVLFTRSDYCIFKHEQDMQPLKKNYINSCHRGQTDPQRFPKLKRYTPWVFIPEDGENHSLVVVYLHNESGSGCLMSYVVFHCCFFVAISHVQLIHEGNICASLPSLD